ncbi:hypothetical protein FAIPA1_10313 [Frankia sp. AiPs1]|nr:DUF4394 domain-containing protein [Frankia sp. AiPa1]
MWFDVRNPFWTVPIGQITGLVGGDTKLIGIDFRPQDNSSTALETSAASI